MSAASSTVSQKTIVLPLSSKFDFHTVPDHHPRRPVFALEDEVEADRIPDVQLELHLLRRRRPHAPAARRRGPAARSSNCKFSTAPLDESTARWAQQASIIQHTIVVDTHATFTVCSCFTAASFMFEQQIFNDLSCVEVAAG